MNEREFYARLVDRLAITARFSRATKVLLMEPPWSCYPAMGFFDVSYKKDVEDIKRFGESPEGRENLWEAMRLFREMPAQGQAELDGIFATFLEATIHALETYSELQKHFRELAIEEDKKERAGHDYKALFWEADWQVYETWEYIRRLLLAIGHKIGPPAYKRLLEALSYQNPAVRCEIVLAFPPDQEVSRFLAAVGHKLLTDPDESVRYNAAYSLELTGHPATAGYFVYALRHDTSYMVRTRSLNGLVSTGGLEHLLVLEQLAKGDFAEVDASRASEFVTDVFRAYVAMRDKLLVKSKPAGGLLNALPWGDKDGNIYECRLRRTEVAGQKFYIVEVKHWNVAARRDCIVEQSQPLADSEISRLQAQWHKLCASYGCPDELCSQDLPQSLTLQ